MESLNPKGFGLTASQIDDVFPFHIAFDRDLRVSRWGAKLPKVCPGLAPAVRMNDLFELVRPHIDFDYPHVRANLRSLFLVRCLASGVSLRGQMVDAGDGQSLLFLCSPWFTDPSQVVQAGLGFDDFPIHDPAMDLLLAVQAQATACGEAIELAERHARQRRDLQSLNAALQQSTAKLREEKDLLATTLANIVDGVIVVDADERVKLLNSTAADLTGWPVDLAPGKPLAQVLRLFDASGKPLPNPVRHVLTTGQPIGDVHALDDRAVIVDNCGQHRTIVLAAVPLLEDEQRKGVLLIFRDITQEIEIEQMRVDFVQSVSHELRTPLTSIRGFISTLQNDPDLPPADRAEFLAIVNEQAQRLGHLVDDVLDISRLEDGSMTFEDISLNLPDVVETSLRAIRPIAEAKNIQLLTRLDDAVPTLTADPARMQSLLTNLLSNAIKFTPPGGRIELTIDPRPHEIRIAVRDTGIGIPADQVHRLFTKFFRVHRPGLEIPGTGLGLAIVKAITLHYGGRIELDSRVGEGSCFRIYLPHHPKPPAAARGAQ